MKKLLLVFASVILITAQVSAPERKIPGATGFTNKGSTLKCSSEVNKVIKGGKASDIVKVSKENHIHRMSINNKPCVLVKNGTRLVIECWDALEGRSKEYFYNKTPYPEIFPNANPATGPIFVEDALPGNTLEIEVHNIRLSGVGFMKLNKNQFIEGADREDVYVETEVSGNQLLFNGRKIPVQSMIGVIGTAGLKEIYCQEAGDNGSNLDTRIIKKGSKVLLPVSVEGALLAIGDIHAVMGDGEVFGQGVEIGAEVEITLRVRKDLNIQRPMIINADRIACIGSNPNVLTAKDLAIQDMGRYLVNVCGFSSMDASVLIAFYGNLCFCQVVNPQKTVRMEIEKQYMNLFEHKSLPF
jgi:amidase